MAHALRAAWKANRHWVAAGFLASTVLFVFLQWANWHNRYRSTASQKATGLGAVAWEPTAMWRQRSILPSFNANRMPPVTGVVGGVPGRAPSRFVTVSAPSASVYDRQVIRSGLLEIIAADPATSSEKLSELATHLSGFIVSSKVSSSGNHAQAAEVVLRLPATVFDEARAEVRKLAKSVAEDVVEARDVTREYVDQEAKLKNLRAAEAQYLAILKRAAAVKDIVEISSKLSDVRGEIEELEADMRFTRHQVEMSQLTINVIAVSQEQAFWIPWKPREQAKIALRDGVASLTEYADSMLGLILFVPVIVVWAVTILALIKISWIVLRKLFLVFFPGGFHWFRPPARPVTT